MKTEEQPLRKEELGLLRELSGGRYAWLRDAAGSLFLFSMIGFAAVSLLVRLLSFLGPLEYTLYAVAFTASLYFAYSLGRSRARTSSAYSEDLKAGVAVETTFEAVDAIKVREFEDFGAGYLLRLGDGGVLFLMGRHLRKAEEDRSFPNSCFTVREAPRSGLLFDFRCSGRYIAPSLVVGPFRKEDVLSGNVPRDGAVYDIDFEALKFRLRTGGVRWPSVPLRPTSAAGG